MRFTKAGRLSHGGRCLSRMKGDKMGISEKKMKIVINNYFKQECDVNTSIREAFEKGFRIGIKKASSAQQDWIPVSERLPEECEEVNITWVNTCPEPYYKDIKDKPFTGSGLYCKGRWYWYSAVCKDLLEEYGVSQADDMDDDIKVTAWRPLPEPYTEESNE